MLIWDVYLLNTTRIMLDSLNIAYLIRLSIFKAPVKVSQHFNSTYRNIVRRNMLHAFGDPVATCCDMLGLLTQIWKWSNFSCDIWGCCMMLWSFGQVRATMLRPSMRTSSIFNTQHVTTCCNRVAKRVQHVAPNNVAVCCVQMLRSFGRSLKTLGQKCWDMLRWSVAIVCPGL